MKIIEYVGDQEDQLLERIIRTSFDADSAFHLGAGKRDGPPGYDNGELLKRVKQEPKVSLYLLQEEIIIGLIVANDSENQILYFCLAPEYMGQGYGTIAWQLFEKFLPNTWQLETPSYSLRNHHFYEKNGFKKIGEKWYSKDKSYIYQKIFSN